MNSLGKFACHLLAICALLSLATEVHAADPPMSKLVVRMILRTVAGDPIPAAPKTIYRAADKFARMEEELNKETGTQMLIITNEPDSWVINLADKTGKHVVDSGPKFDTEAPIFWTVSGQPEPDFTDLQFGKEMDFFGGGRGLELKKPRKVEGKNYKAISIKTGEHEAIMMLDPSTKKPFQIDLMKFGRLVASARYISYKTNLPFNAALFHPPGGVQLTEQH